jgi:hypothetical protein
MRRMLSSMLGLAVVAWVGGCVSGDPLYDTDEDGVRDSVDCEPADPEVFQSNSDPVDAAGLDGNCDGIDGVDADRDGYASVASGGDDCQDQDAAIHPGAPEVPDDWVDNDCTGGDATCDSDGDGVAATLCDGPDCDDSNSLVQPGADELCDGLDTDCDGAVPADELDADGDGIRACAGDCDDGDAGVSPGLAEVCDGLDTDCDGSLPTDEVDVDADGWPPCDGDCDDLDPARYPGAAPACEGLDTDCDGALEPGDVDGDGDGDPACTDCDDDHGTLHGLDLDADGFTSCFGDCDDLAPTVFPGGVDDWGDGVDGDCDGIDGVDADADGWAANGVPADCLDDAADPASADTWPGAPDHVGDDVDQGCDGLDGVDADGDGVASIASGGDDCNDAADDPYAALTFPGAEDLVGNGLDTDCDGLDGVDADGDDHPSTASGGDDCLDNPSDPLADSTFPGAPDPAGDGADTDCDGTDGVDADGDGFASEASGGADCDDDPSEPLAAFTFPGAEDLVGNGADTDCDGADGVDADGDGVPSIASGGADCDDDPASPTAADTWPGAPDTVGDGVDQGCDDIDGVDGDGDGVASTSSGGTDCLDDPSEPLSPLTWPAAADPWSDGADTNCDGLDGVDGDGDGWAINAVGELQDCDDADPQVYPGSDELPGWQSPRLGLDEDCDGSTWEWLGDTSVRLDAEASMDEAGTSVTSAGDVDGDGLDDVLVGAPLNDTAHSTAGSVYLVLGSTLSAGGPLSLAGAHAQVVGEGAGDLLGHTIAGVGDVDGGGRPDIFVGAPGNDLGGSNSGRAYLFRGEDLAAGGVFDASTAWASIAGQAGTWAATRVAGAGDVDGDGLSDLLLDAPYDDTGGAGAGRVYLFLGSQVGSGGDFGIAEAHASFIGEEAWDGAGQGLAGAGDVDGDGLDDVLIGVPLFDGAGDYAGKACLFFGDSLLAGGDFDLSQADLHLLGEVAGDKAGVPVAAAGDVDGDGLADLLVGASNNNEGGYTAGKSYLVYGSTASAGGTLSLASADVVIIGEAEGDESGKVAGAGDVDGDGLDDVLVGAPGNGDGGSDAGKTHLFYGATLNAGGAFTLAGSDAAFVGEAAADHSGHVASSAGDVNGDGFADLLVGAQNPYTTDTGRAHVVLSPW